MHKVYCIKVHKVHKGTRGQDTKEAVQGLDYKGIMIHNKYIQNKHNAKKGHAMKHHDGV